MSLASIGKVPLAIFGATVAAVVYLLLDPAVTAPPKWTVVPAQYDAGVRLLAGLGPERPITRALVPVALAAHRVTTTLRVWVFARTHYDAYVALAPSFEARHPGIRVVIQLVSWQAVTNRLRAAFWADLDVPDLVECEISVAGSFFRGPLDQIGFVDLTPWLKASGWYDRLVHTRFAPWSIQGHIFGLPHDVHPVTLAYRRDLFEAAGVDPASLETWDDFVRVARKLMGQADAYGQFQRYMLELSDNWVGDLETLLFQRDGGYFDAEGKVVFDNATAIETMRWYVPLVAGPTRIGNSLPGGQEIMAQALESGYFLCILTPDWRSRLLFETVVPRMKGQWAMMPLPAVTRGGRRTSTLGGTMVGVTKKCPDQALALALALHLYYDRTHLPERFANTNILPPLKEAWSDAEFDRPRAYWSGQPIGRIYAALANETPPQYTSPFIVPAKTKLAQALVACVQYYQRHGAEGFDAFVERTLKDCAAEVRRLIERDPFRRDDADEETR